MNELYENEIKQNIKSLSEDRDFKGLSNIFIRLSVHHKYSYNFTWLGIPIIQVPQDIYVMQELIWKVRPDLIIETGIAHGGSLIMSASMLALLDYCDGNDNFMTNRKVIGIDTDIRPHNKEAIKRHPLSNFIHMFEGSSVDDNVIKHVREMTKCYNKIIVFLDSNHTHEHVLQELLSYAPLVSIGSYCVVWDSGIEELPTYMLENNGKPWGKGSNPKTAVHEFLKIDNNSTIFEIDKELENKLMITSVSDGFLRRIK